MPLTSMTGVVGANGENFNDQRLMMRNNVETFRRLLDWAIETKMRVVWASSCSVYGRGPVPMKESQALDPLNIYAFSKLTRDRLAARYTSSYDHGTFDLARVPARKDSPPAHARH